MFFSRSRFIYSKSPQVTFLTESRLQVDFKSVLVKSSRFHQTKSLPGLSATTPAPNNDQINCRWNRQRLHTISCHVRVYLSCSQNGSILSGIIWGFRFLMKNWWSDENIVFWRNLTKFNKWSKIVHCKLAKFGICGKIFDDICTFCRMKNGIFGGKILCSLRIPNIQPSPVFSWER